MGLPIAGLNTATPSQSQVFHAGTRINEDRVVTAGGRVLCVCAMADSVSDAAKAAYGRCEKITWDGAYYRRDIGHRAIARELAGTTDTSAS